MYCPYFGMKERPFTLTPNPEFIFLGAVQQEAFAHLVYGIDQRVGFISLTGEVGTGKTTVVRTLLSRLQPESYATALILNPMLSTLGLLKAVNHEFGIDEAGNDPADLVATLNLFLLEQQRQNKIVILIIDEAQNLTPDLLEQVRLLSNLETSTEKLIQIVFVGQPELEVLLERTDLRQLNQRITVRYHMAPMSLPETQAYIEHRLRVSGSTPDLIRFDNRALLKIHKLSNGYPRIINAIADRALLISYTSNTRVVTTDIIVKAAQDVLKTTSNINRSPFNYVRTVILSIIIVFILCFLYLYISNTSVTIGSTRHIKHGNIHTSIEALDLDSIVSIVFSMWNVQKPDAHLKATSIDQQLREVGFESYRFNGTLKELSKIGYPAIALMTDIKSKQKYHTIITNISNETISLLNSSGNSYMISSSQFEKNWSGVAQIPWRNALHLSIPVDYRHDIEERNLLARLIKTTGVKIADNNQITSEQEVRNALKQFQSSQGIASEGIAGEHTLFLLYRHSTEFRQPTAVK